MGEPSGAGTPRSSRVLGALLLGAVFVLGMISGAALFYAGQRSIVRERPVAGRGPGWLRPGPPESLERFERAADLTPEQREQFRAIMRETREEMHAIVGRSRERLGEVLTPEQRAKFDGLRPREHRRRGDRPRRQHQ